MSIYVVLLNVSRKNKQSQIDHNGVILQWGSGYDTFSGELCLIMRGLD
jgi:hypothetical protein